MRIKPLILIVLFSSICHIGHADLKDPSILSVTEGEPELNISDAVNAITGDFVVQQQDLVVQGAEPLSLKRFYISGNGEGPDRGWVFNPHHILRLLKNRSISPKTTI